ncbi:hypothetical protein, partial [Tannerella forsythia]
LCFYLPGVKSRGFYLNLHRIIAVFANATNKKMNIEKKTLFSIRNWILRTNKPVWGYSSVKGLTCVF